MNADTLVLLLILYDIFYYFWTITWMMNADDFKIAKVQPWGVA